MIRSFMILTILVALLACDKEPQLKGVLRSENSDLASVLKIDSAQTMVYIADFFPTIGSIDSVVCRGISVQPLQADFKVIRLGVNSGSARLGELNVWSGGACASVVVQNLTIAQDIEEKPVIASGGFHNREITIWEDEDPTTIVALWQNTVLPREFVVRKDDKFVVRIPINADSVARSYIRVFASNEDGLSNDVIVPLDYGIPVSTLSQLDRTDKHAMILYSVMIDRFYNGNKSNDRKLNSPEVVDRVDYQGGDLAGITQKIKDGFFNDLGINTIWLSPITQNPLDAWGQYSDPKTKFSGYHGYWPLYSTVIDSRFGTPEELRELLEEAHKRDLNVILDYVSNHMHINSPTLKANPEWTTDLYLPDGRENLELWDEYRLTTWFDKHIPTLDLERPEVAEAISDSALYWLDNYDFDGFRHDATKHIPLSYWRMLTNKMKSRYSDRKFYQIGETYGNSQLIGSYVKSGMLDGQFDFNVYDEMTWALATKEGSFKNLARVLQNSLDTYGYHNAMGYITGNHDRARFISYAGAALSFDEDSKAAGWRRQITVGDTTGYDKLTLLEAFIFTIPGIPCVYQGDEYGVPGGNDPDNRRMMAFDGYNGAETKLFDNVKRLIELRKSSLPLIFGDYVPLLVEDDVYAYMRIYLGNANIVALNKSPLEKKFEFEVSFDKLYVGTLRANFGNKVKINKDKVTITLAPYGFEVLTPKMN